MVLHQKVVNDDDIGPRIETRREILHLPLLCIDALFYVEQVQLLVEPASWVASALLALNLWNPLDNMHIWMRDVHSVGATICVPNPNFPI